MLGCEDSYGRQKLLAHRLGTIVVTNIGEKIKNKISNILEGCHGSRKYNLGRQCWYDLGISQVLYEICFVAFVGAIGRYS